MEIKTLKQALEACERLYIPDFTQDDSPINNCITSLRQAIAEAEKQEPVAWRGYNWGHSPDDWVYRDFDDPILDGNGNNVGQPLYTTPPQRTWVGLTDEDKAELDEKYGDDTLAHLDAVEDKLKEKNT